MIGPNKPGTIANETGTAETIDPDGWLHTGDVATMDEDGSFTIVDRITAGFNVYRPRSNASCARTRRPRSLSRRSALGRMGRILRPADTSLRS